MFDKIFGMDDIPEKLFNIGERKFFRKNDIIIHQGQLINYLYILVKGKILIYRYTNKGLMYYNRLLIPACTFGEAHVLTQKEITGSFICLENTEVIMIPRKTLLDLIKNDFNISIFIYDVTAKKIGTYNGHAEEFASLSSEQKIIFFLIELAEKLSIKIEGKIKIDLNISQQFISKFTSVERTSTVRAFNKLKEKHILEYDNGYYYINDLDLLKKMIN